ncbi:pyruvate formate-lyase-activating protein [Intestinibacter sp.]
MLKGRVHSIETFGTVDGPGIRYIIFFQGCPLRCKYCHNRDTWKANVGNEYTVDELIQDITKYQSYMQFSGGGVTASGGEATLQTEFVTELFKRCKELGIHTCLDTSGFINVNQIDELLDYTDLVLLDIKHIDNEKCKELTGVGNEKCLKLAKHLDERGIPVWIRQVLIPGITDDAEDLKKLGQFVSSLNNVDRFEFLPYHGMGIHKWESMGLEYELKDVKDPTEEEIRRANNIVQSCGVAVHNKIAK